MIVDKPTWNRFFRDFTISRGAIADKDRYTFVMSGKADPWNRDTPVPTRFLHVRTTHPMDRRFGYKQYDGFELTRATFSWLHDEPYTFIAIDMNGLVYVRNNEINDYEEPDLTDATAWQTAKGHRHAGAALTRIKRVGSEVFIVGLDHFIFRRLGPGRWEPFPGMERPKELDQNPKANNLAFGFRDISAFGPEDLYAAGGHGDVWRFDGHAWSRCDFPSNEPLHTVCCAGDGKVYLTGRDGSVWAGLKDTWKPIIHPGRLSLSFDHALWFSGRMWFGMDDGLFELKGNKLERVDFPAETFGMGQVSGHIDISLDGKHMLTCNLHGAALFDGKTWEPLFNASEFEPERFEDEEEDA